MLKLTNQGNTCYINSILQILHALNIKHNFVYKPNERFKKFEQNDQHDFLLFILDFINETTAVKFPKPIFQKSDKLKYEAMNNLFNYGLNINKKDPDSIYISNIFDFIGQRITEYLCKKCGFRMQKFDVFKSLELSIPEQVGSLKDCLNYTFSHTFVPDYTCENCNKKSAIWQKQSIWRLPNILSLLFVRNIFQNNTPIKNDAKIKFDTIINLNDYYAFNTEKNNLYEINSIAYHFGKPNGGHCTSICKKNNIWYHCDDSNVQPIDIENIPVNNAYILFYIKL
jgi:ubiquitin C-terminal hydrolase